MSSVSSSSSSSSSTLSPSAFSSIQLFQEEINRLNEDILQLKGKNDEFNAQVKDEKVADALKKEYLVLMGKNLDQISTIRAQIMKKEDDIRALHSSLMTATSSSAAPSLASKHQYQGVIVNCTVVAPNNANFEISLLVDSGFSGELQLPRAKCEQMGLTIGENVPVDRPGGVVTYEHEYKEQVLVIVTMDDGSEFRQYLTVTSTASSLGATASASSASSQPLTNPSLLYDESSASNGSGSEKDSSTAFQSPPRPPRRTEYALLATKKLSPVKFDDKVEGKYHITDCLLGYTGLQKFGFLIDPKQHRICAVFRHPRFV